MNPNPNDSQENPEAPVHMRRGLGSNSDRHPLPPPPDSHPLPPPPDRHPLPLPPAVKSTVSADRNRSDGHSRQNAPNKHKSIDHQKGSRGNRIMASESGSEKSSTSDHSQSTPRRSNSGKKKFGWALSSSFGSKKHKKTSSIPKFGDWNEKDPKSGEGFTEIFERAKAEKKDASSQFPASQSNVSDSHKSEYHWSKMFCCVFPRGADQ